MPRIQSRVDILVAKMLTRRKKMGEVKSVWELMTLDSITRPTYVLVCPNGPSGPNFSGRLELSLLVRVCNSRLCCNKKDIFGTYIDAR